MIPGPVRVTAYPAHIDSGGRGSSEQGQAGPVSWPVE